MVTLVVGAVGAFLAYAVGGLVGFASSLLFLPVLLLLGVPLVEAVAVNLVLAILTRLPSLVALRADVDVRRTATLLAGSVPGVGLGVVTARAVPQHVLEVAAGVLVLASGLYLLAAREVSGARNVSPGVTAAAGACSGLMGVTTSLNGIPPAVLLARSGATVRTRLADLSAFFAVGNCLTLAVLAATRDVPVLPVSSGSATWLVAGLAGNAAGLRLAGHLDPRRFDLLTVLLVLLSGCGALGGALL